MNRARALRAALVLLLFATAFFLRAREPERVRFGIDQSSHFEPILYMVRDGEFPLVGHDVSFTPAKLGPLHYYLYAPPMLLSFDPVWSVRWSALLNALGVPLLFLAGRGRFPFAASLAAATLYAVSPHLVFVSRELWNLAALLPLNLLLLALALEAFDRSSARLSALALGVAAAATQLHLVAVLPALALLVALPLRLRPGARLPALAGGLALSLLVYAPWILHQFLNGFEDVLAYAAFLGGSSEGSAIAPNAQGLSLLLDYPRWILHYVDGYRSGFFASPAFAAPARLEQALFLLSFPLLARNAFAGRTLPALRARLLLALLFGPLLLLHLFRFELFDRHFLPLFPLPQIFVGLAVARLLSGGGARAVALGLPLALAAFSLFLQNFEFTRQIERTALVKEESPLSLKRRMAHAAAERFGPVDPFSAEGSIHALGTRDQPSDLRLLAQLLGLFPPDGAERDPVLDHLLLLRTREEEDALVSAEGEFLRRIRGETLVAAGRTRLLAVPALVDYGSLRMRPADDTAAPWRPFRNPLVEFEGRSPLRVRGTFRAPGGGLAAALCVHTNLPLSEVLLNGRPVEPLYPYDAQGTTDEVAASARVFRVAAEDLAPENEFSFRAGPVRRWFGLDVYALPVAPEAERTLRLFPGAALLTSASDGGTIECAFAGAAARVAWRLEGPDDYAYLRLAPDPPPDFAAYRRVRATLVPDGRPGLLRLLATEAGGEEWIFDDYALLAHAGEQTLDAPYARFTNPAWAKRGDGRFDPDRVVSLALGFHPYRTAEGTREARLVRIALED